MSLTDEQRMAILDEIVEATTPPAQKAYQFTRREYQDRRPGLTGAQAQGALERAVAAGVLKREQISSFIMVSRKALASGFLDQGPISKTGKLTERTRH